MEFKKLNFNEAEINLTLKGNIKKNAVIFLHGNSLSSSSFKNQLENLNLPMLAIDLPGHGQSDPAKNPEETYSMPGYAKAVRSVIDQLQLQDFILVGHSLGGHIAINVAGSEKNTKGLLLFGTPPLDVVSSFGNAFLPNPLFPLLLQSDVTENQALQLAEDILLQQEQKENLIKDILNTDPNARAHFAAFVGNGVIEDEIKMINSFYFPTAILHGEKDTIANKEYIENIGFQNLWNNKLHIINNSGHCPQIEQHQTFNDLLNDYYKSVV